MKKVKTTSISINYNIDGKLQTIQFQTEQLRNWINTLEFNQAEATLVFNFEGKQYSIEFNSSELSQIKQAVKYAELYQNIIPKKLKNVLVDYTQVISQKTKKLAPVIGREHEIEKTWFYLSQEKRNNVFLVGTVDVGKTAIATEIARKIAINDCPKQFYEKRVIMLNPESLLAIKTDFLFKHMISQILYFLEKNKNIVIYIDKAIYMTTDILLIDILYFCIKKHIPFISTIDEESYANFCTDLNIVKYLNSVNVDEPELNELEPMILPHIKKLEKKYKIKIPDKIIKYGIFTSELSNSISGNPGKIINIFERAFSTAKYENKTEVDKKCISNCYDIKLNYYLKMPIEEKRATAYHETGHYLMGVNSNYRKNEKISCVSILPTLSWEGVTISYYDIETYAIYSREYFIDCIAVSLAGRIAEKKFTNMNSAGASTDLQTANNIAKTMILEWGFSEKASLNRQYSNIDYYLLSEDKKKSIDDEIQDLINKGTQRATKVIEENSELLKIIAEKLLAEEILTGEELEEICKKFSD